MVAYPVKAINIFKSSLNLSLFNGTWLIYYSIFKFSQISFQFTSIAQLPKGMQSGISVD